VFASDEQNLAIRGGVGPASFEWLTPPEGPQPIPFWAKGLTVEWMDGYCNPPHYTVKTVENPRDWPRKVFTREGSRYLALSGDGRAECYYHSGEPKLCPLMRRVHSLVGMYAPGKLPGPSSWRFHAGKYHWDEVYYALATPQQEGFGGDSYTLHLDDGRTVVLRGPWHGPSPAGYLDVGFSCPSKWPSGKPYRSLLGGTISEEVLILLLARYQPHLRIARVTEGGRTHVEAVREDWDVPKNFRKEKR
jgi:hypothetical protein